MTNIDDIDGKFDNRILNLNVEPDRPDDDYNSTLKSHVEPFLTAIFMAVVIAAIAIAMTPLPVLQKLFF